MAELELSADEMRRNGYEVVDWLVERLPQLQTGPVLRESSPEEMRSRFSGPPPEGPVPLPELLGTLEQDVLPFSGVWSHPRFFGYIPGSGTWPGALADFIVSACNLDASTWREAAGLSRVEQVVIDWMKSWVGYPGDAGGLLTSGGSAANMTALAAARHHAVGEMDQRAVVYVSDQAHSSLARACRVLGFRSDQVRVLASDRAFRMDPDLLDRAIGADLERGMVPVMVAAAAGSTNTGAVDPFDAIADVCDAHDVWFHIDGAYGGFAMLTDHGRALMTGIDRADSITVDPHKWLYQPFECGGLLVRRPGVLAEAFRITPPYLEDAHDSTATDYSNLGMQLSRSSRALKVWMSVANLGLGAFRRAIDSSISLAQDLERRIAADDRFELLSPAHLSVVCFRRTLPNADETALEELNAGLVAALAASGVGLVSSTRLAGTYAIRMCVFNHTTTAEDVDAVLDWLANAEPTRADQAPQPRDALGTSGWLDADVEGNLRRHPLFADTPDPVVDQIIASGQEQRVPAGWMIVEEMKTTNEFHVILEGKVTVTTVGRVVATLEGGSFFGEIAALDWGAGYGSPRMATVTATEETRLFTIPATVLNRAMRSSPDLRRHIETTAARRRDGAGDGSTDQAVVTPV